MERPAAAAVWLDRGALAMGYALVVLCFGQVSEFIDSSGYLLASQRGVNDETRHVTFTPLLIAWTRALGGLGLSHLEASRALAAVSAAVAVVSAHGVATTVGFDRRSAALAAMLVACSPVVLFVGTVVNPYASAFAVASLAMWCAARATGRGSLVALLGAGLLSALASTVHSTAHTVALTIAVFVFCGAPLAATGAKPGRLRCLGWAATVLVGHLLGGAVYATLAAVFGWSPGSSVSFHYLLGHLRIVGDSLHAIPHTLFEEWVFAYLPLAATPVVVAFQRRCRGLAVAAVVVLAGLLVLCHVMIQGGLARGVYILPVSIPFAALTVFVLPRRLVLPLCAAGLVCGITSVRVHDRPERAAAYVEGLREFVGDAGEGAAVAAFLITGIGVDMEARFATLPEQEMLFVHDILRYSGDQVAAALPAFDAFVDEQVAAQRPVLFTADARRWLEQVRTFPGWDRNPGQVLQDHLVARYRLLPVRARGFTAERLVPR